MDNDSLQAEQERISAAIDGIGSGSSMERRPEFNRRTSGKRPGPVGRSIADSDRFASSGESGPVRISSVDTREFPDVSVFFTASADAVGDRITGDDVELQEDGTVRDVSITPPAESTADVVLVFDDAGDMLEEVVAARKAVSGFVSRLSTAGVDARYALVRAEETVDIATDFPAERAALFDTIADLSGSLGVDRDRHTREALEVATGQATDEAGNRLSAFRPDAQCVVLYVTDAPAAVVPDGTEGPGAESDAVRPRARGVTYAEVSGARGEETGDDATLLAEVIGGTWFERPGASANAFRSLLTDVIASRLAKMCVATYTSDRSPDSSAESSIGVAIDGREGRHTATRRCNFP